MRSAVGPRQTASCCGYVAVDISMHRLLIHGTRAPGVARWQTPMPAIFAAAERFLKSLTYSSTGELHFRSCHRMRNGLAEQRCVPSSLYALPACCTETRRVYLKQCGRFVEQRTGQRRALLNALNRCLLQIVSECHSFASFRSQNHAAPSIQARAARLRWRRNRRNGEIMGVVLMPLFNVATEHLFDKMD